MANKKIKSASYMYKGTSNSFVATVVCESIWFGKFPWLQGKVLSYIWIAALYDMPLYMKSTVEKLTLDIEISFALC